MLRGLERTTTRPRGGVNRVMLIAAGSFAGDGFVESGPAAGSFAAGSFTGAEDDRAAGRMVSFAATEPPVEYVFREDGARWSESVVSGTFSGGSGVSSGGSGNGSSDVSLGGLSARVKHTLSMEFPCSEASRCAVSELVALSGSGSGSGSVLGEISCSGQGSGSDSGSGVGSGSYGGSGSGLGSGGGFVAIVTLASGERIIGGYSSRFGVGYPLRVVKVTAASGSVPGDYAAISVVLESEDADFAKCLV